jgi:mono/diheme cytochrome c family protein
MTGPSLRKIGLRCGVAALLLAGGWGLRGASQDAPRAPAPAQDDEDREVELAEGRQVFLDNCLICHSEEMTTRQRLTSKQWEAELTKMVGWGAPVPKDQEPTLLRFLVTQYSPTAPLDPPPTLPPDRALLAARQEPPGPPPGDPERGATLHATHCANCHGPLGQGAELGPNLVEKPVLLRKADYEEVLRQGRHRMPSYREVLTPQQEGDILAWLRERRYGEGNSR